jgi:hypothetical protein
MSQRYSLSHSPLPVGWPSIRISFTVCPYIQSANQVKASFPTNQLFDYI